MEQSTAALDQFISDFKLRNPEGIIFFQAIIYLLINRNMQVQESEIHIITSSDLATVYINDLDSHFFQLPQMFEAKKQLFTSIAGKGLKIEGDSGNGRFSISIYPKDK